MPGSYFLLFSPDYQPPLTICLPKPICNSQLITRNNLSPTPLITLLTFLLLCPFSKTSALEKFSKPCFLLLCQNGWVLLETVTLFDWLIPPKTHDFHSQTVFSISWKFWLTIFLDHLNHLSQTHLFLHVLYSVLILILTDILFLFGKQNLNKNNRQNIPLTTILDNT